MHAKNVAILLAQGRYKDAKAAQRAEVARVLPADIPDDQPVDGEAFVDLLRARLMLNRYEARHN